MVDLSLFALMRPACTTRPLYECARCEIKQRHLPARRFDGLDWRLGCSIAAYQNKKERGSEVERLAYCTVARVRGALRAGRNGPGCAARADV